MAGIISDLAAIGNRGTGRYHGPMRHLLALLLVIALALPAWAQDRPRAGLMWNRSGLPATLPLVVGTEPGQDYVVFLVPPDGGDPVMAGYIHGGTFFRLLVPPGSWHVRFAHGREWQGGDTLFGPDTEWTGVDEPMTFGSGVARRHGYIVRLAEHEGRMQIASTGPLDQCQDLYVTSEIIHLDEERETAIKRLTTSGLRKLDIEQDEEPEVNTNRLPAPGLRDLDIQVDTRSQVCP
ncbi:hypothetical protein [Paracoccus benzoatiresistens]|uniref:DUF2846 domain-containing protein n=1 Tax=Paracoccus benzoatiresistens TaxID=2997341 RepID=A0ABT4J3E2_9RHOB|nr:hypothetical protein [Paracoccus sp. EF6]MCZ0961607.1 hypothetical protein [Paracoccus sp. EF6]